MTAGPVEPDLTGKVSVVTGATGGMGRVIATQLARRGSIVVIPVRNRDRGEDLRRQVAARVGADRVEVLTGDLAARADLHRLAEELTSRHRHLHLLVNNAGAHFRQRALTDDGIERHIAIDYLAGITLTALLLAQLRAAAPARVVNVASAAVLDTRMLKFRRRPRPPRIDPAQLDDLERLNPAAGWTPMGAYGTAKMLTVMSGYHLADMLRGTGVTVNAVHPGLVNTSILDDIAPPFMKPVLPLARRLQLPAEVGARATLDVATATKFDEVTGAFFDRDTERHTPDPSHDAALQKRLWDTTTAYIARQDGRSTE